MLHFPIYRKMPVGIAARGAFDRNSGIVQINICPKPDQFDYSDFCWMIHCPGS
jgi:hypothetical protein